MVNLQAFSEDITAELAERIVILAVVLDDEVIPGPVRPVAFATGHREICFHTIFSQNIVERCSEWSAGLGLSSLALHPDLGRLYKLQNVHWPQVLAASSGSNIHLFSNR